jgi:hypothetical protein
MAKRKSKRLQETKSAKLRNAVHRFCAMRWCFLNKEGTSYSLTQDSAIFLDRRSPAYLGGSIQFLLSPPSPERFRELTAAIRKGGTVIDHNSSPWVTDCSRSRWPAIIPAPRYGLWIGRTC